MSLVLTVFFGIIKFKVFIIILIEDNRYSTKYHRGGATVLKKTLAILAAGIGSRFGGGIKQLTGVGPNGEIIIDYSIHDAIAAGFDKIVFIIRKDIEEPFKEVIGNRIEELCSSLGVEVCYAFQELENVPIALPEGRTKPWGTGHAILACEGIIDEAFAVINADDYYGKKGYKQAADFLNNNSYGMIAYILKNTLSDNGGVTRGICHVEDGKLSGITETHNIIKTPVGAAAEGIDIDLDSLVSMNFFCYPDTFMGILKEDFPVFLSNMTNPLKDEYLLPTITDGLIKKGTELTVMSTDDQWFGVTYIEDKEAVIESFRKLYEQGMYNADNLYSDLK